MRTQILIGAVLVAALSGPALAAIEIGDMVVASWSGNGAVWLVSSGGGWKETFTNMGADGGLDVEWSADNSVFYTSNYYQDTIFRYDGVSGAQLAPFATYDHDVTLKGLAVDRSTGDVYVALKDDVDALEGVHKYNSAGVLQAYYPLATGAGALEFGNGKLYCGMDGAIYRLDGASWTAFATPTGQWVRDLLWADNGLWISHNRSGSLKLQKFDATGALVGDYTTSFRMGGLESDGTRLYVGYGVGALIYTVNYDGTGETLWTSSGVGQGDALAIKVPEPCTLALLAAGGLLALRRRR